MVIDFHLSNVFLSHEVSVQDLQRSNGKAVINFKKLEDFECLQPVREEKLLSSFELRLFIRN